MHKQRLQVAAATMLGSMILFGCASCAKSDVPPKQTSKFEGPFESTATVIDGSVVRVDYGHGIRVTVLNDSGGEAYELPPLGGPFRTFAFAERKVLSLKAAPFLEQGCVLTFVIEGAPNAPPECYWAVNKDVNDRDSAWGTGPVPIADAGPQGKYHVLSVENFGGDTIEMITRSQFVDETGRPREFEFRWYSDPCPGFESKPLGQAMQLTFRELPNASE